MFVGNKGEGKYNDGETREARETRETGEKSFRLLG